jgi:microcystin-dependent protein
MDPYLGGIYQFGFNFAPQGYALALGQTLAIAQNQALFSLLGTTYGGDGRTTFLLPDLRGRTPLNFGQGPGTSNYNIGQVSGVASTVLNVSNLPQHTHALVANSVDATTPIPTSNVLGKMPMVGSGSSAAQLNLYTTNTATGTMSATALNANGNGAALNIMQPYLTLNFSVALAGIFPSRS